MLIDKFMPEWDASERHAISVAAPPAAVWRSLLALDLRQLRLAQALLALRALPALLSGRRKGLAPRAPLTLGSMEKAGFGRLAEAPGEELVLGVTGRFWRPAGNLEPFDRVAFDGPVAEGLARAVWNFAVLPDGAGTRLSTETRILTGDNASRRKFRLYWFLVRPGSGLIRHLVLRAVRRSCESGTADTGPGGG